ncbi:PREDICTED: F-box [Prunus dulcis]|uniref:PREDICTED: F-box n=1 Tax=Prunus dulcis TaxID=3755 RepID=A0A5E4E3K1_PRUDU|nr:PREDICTED: F-box [Prunus dulcis]
MRCVSKTTLHMVDNPYFATLHTPRLLNSSGTNYAAAVEVPQLMLLAQSWSSRAKRLTALQSLKYSGEHGLTKSKHWHANILSEVGNYQVDFVFCNLVCLKHEIRNFGLLLNPLRGEVLDLPTNHLLPTYGKKWYGMGFDSITSTHKIVCISEIDRYKYLIHRHRDILVAYVYTLGARSSSWQEIHSVPQCEFSSKNVSAYGDMHWLIDRDVVGGNYVVGENPNYIISFDFKKDEFVWNPYPNSSQGFVRGSHDMHLLNLGGCLAILSSGHLSVEIWVLRNYEKKEWALDYKIDNKMFFGRSLRSIETCGEWEHGIFLTEKYPIIFYFWDMRYKSMRYINHEKLLPGIFSYYHLPGTRRSQLKLKLSILSYTKSLISSETYGNLVERRVCSKTAKTRTWQIE